MLAAALAALALVEGCAAPRVVAPEEAAYAGRRLVATIAWRTALLEPDVFEKQSEQFGGVGVDDEVGVVAAALSTGDLVGLDQKTGVERWRVSMPGPFGGAPSAAGGTFFAASGAGRVASVDARTGRVKWTRELGQAVNSAVVVSGDLLLVATTQGTLHALNPSDGALRWSREQAVGRGMTLQTDGVAAATGRAVWLGYADGTLGSFERDGRPRWKVSLGRDASRFKDVDTEPLVLGDSVVAASFAGGLYSLNAETGAVQWHADLEGVANVRRALDSLVATTGNGEVVWIDPATGAVTQRLRLDSCAPDGLVVQSGYLFVPTSERGLYVLDAKAPWIHARIEPGSGFSSAPVVRRGVLYTLSDGGVVYAISLTNP
jgi:outer membrane protein assembly factor BamB